MSQRAASIAYSLFLFTRHQCHKTIRQESKKQKKKNKNCLTQPISHQALFNCLKNTSVYSSHVQRNSRENHPKCGSKLHLQYGPRLETISLDYKKSTYSKDATKITLKFRVQYRSTLICFVWIHCHNTRVILLFFPFQGLLSCWALFLFENRQYKF